MAHLDGLGGDWHIVVVIDVVVRAIIVLLAPVLGLFGDTEEDLLERGKRHQHVGDAQLLLLRLQ